MADSLTSSFLSPPPFSLSSPKPKPKPKPNPNLHFNPTCCSIFPDPWTLSDGTHINNPKPKPRSKNPKNPLSDDDARRIITAKARYLSALRRNQGSAARTPRWVRRTPEQMVQYLEDDHNGHLYGRHVVAAIKKVRALSQKAEGSYEMRAVMGSFVTKLSFREMCVVLKEQKGWRQVRDFFAWMKLQFCYHPSVIVYTIVLRAYGQVGKIKLAEQTFLEMLDAGCEPDEIACGTMLCTYARWGRHNAMLTFYSAVHQKGVILPVTVYNFMLSSLQKKQHHQDVIRMYRDMVNNTVVPNHFTFTVVICSLVKTGLLDEGFNAFYEMKNLRFVPEEVTYSLLITSTVKEGQQDKALKLYEEMSSRRIVPSNFTCASLLNLFYKNGDYPKALSLFSEMERNKIQADEVIYGLLIRIYGKLGLYEDAEKTFEEAERMGMLSDEKTFIAMAQVHLSFGDYRKAINTMSLMRSLNIQLTRFTYTVLLKCYMLNGDLGSAEVTFQSLSKTCVPNSSFCNNMLNMYVRLELLEKAKNFVIQIRKDKVELDEELTRTIMKLYVKEGMLQEAEQFIEEIRSNGSLENSKFVRTISTVLQAGIGKIGKLEGNLVTLGFPDTGALELMLRLYLANGDTRRIDSSLSRLLDAADGLSICNQLISKFIREGDTSKAEMLYDLLVKQESRPEDAAIASMISSYGKQQKLERAKEIFAALSDTTTLGKPVYNSMIEACARCGQPEESYQLYNEAVDREIEVGAVTISMLVNSLSNHGKHQEAEDAIHISLRQDMELDTVAYNTFIKAMLEAGKLRFAVCIYDHMLSRGVSPSIQTHSILISVYGRGRNLDKAVEMFEAARNLGVALDEKLYANLISVYGKSGKAEEACALFTEMRENGIKPGKVMISMQSESLLVRTCTRPNRRPVKG